MPLEGRKYEKKNLSHLEGVFGKPNEFYIGTAILEPEKKIISGYLPGMASYKGPLTDGQIDSLIMYIRTLRE